MKTLEQHFQYLLHLDGHHPGPLFGEIPKQRKSTYRELRKRYHMRRRRATPPWADAAKIRLVYDEAKRLTKLTGVPHTVDHVIPLKGEIVSGLHVHNNLQVLTWAENQRKSNIFVDQPSLF